MIAEAVRANGVDYFPLWAENVEAMDLLIAMQTQVRTAGINGRVVGLDYTVLPWVMQQLGIQPERMAGVFKQLQTAEQELLA